MLMNLFLASSPVHKPVVKVAGHFAKSVAKSIAHHQAVHAVTKAGSKAIHSSGGFHLPLLINPLFYLGLVIILLLVTKFGWGKLMIKYNTRGEALPDLSNLYARSKSFILKEDQYQVFNPNSNPKWAERTPWLLWRRVWKAGFFGFFGNLALGFLFRPFEYFMWLSVIIIWICVMHARKVFAFRHRKLMQMFEVASAEFKYQGGANLNPWGWINISEWHELYSPGVTNIMFAPKYRSEDAGNRKGFETNFNGTVSDQHTWTYEWESANNRVVCTPVPFIAEVAEYRFPDNKPWNEFPLGIASGGEEAKWNCAVSPHLLLAGVTGSGKKLKLTTKIPVPISIKNNSGWSTIGELKLDDKLFDIDGKICKVIKLFDIDMTPNLYRVYFSDNSFLDADANHLWWTETRLNRESRWNTKNQNAERKETLSPEIRANLEKLLQATSEDAEISIPELSKIIDVLPTCGWLHDLAKSIGPVSEVTVISEFNYAEQTVIQNQKLTIFDAPEVWKALESYRPKESAPWYIGLSERIAKAKLAKPNGEVTAMELLPIVGSKEATHLLQICKRLNIKYSLGIRPVPFEANTAKGGAQNRKMAIFEASEIWPIFENYKQKVIPNKFQDLAIRVAKAKINRPIGEITAVEIMDVLGTSEIGSGIRLLKRLGVRSEVAIRSVPLKVPAKTLYRKHPTTIPMYNKKRLLELVIQHGTRILSDQRHKKTVGSVKTTKEILETLLTSNGSLNHSIPVAKPLDLPDMKLPISPYTLGVWLGDGTSRRGEFCGIDHEIASLVEKEGYALTESIPKGTRNKSFRIWKSKDLHKDLIESNLINKKSEKTKKHIPSIYLRSSIAQRQLLLAGLLDTDGTVTSNGGAEFTNTKKAIAYGAYELAISLGYRATIREGRSRLYGKDCGPKWTVGWNCKESPFRLTRKTDLFNKRSKNYNAEKNESRYIVSVEPIPSEPARCISVDSPSRLFLAGEAMIPTHNSTTQRTMLLHALQSPDWRVVLVDPKRVELSVYKGHPNVLRVATELEDSIALIEQVEQEMQSRYLQMQEAGVNFFKNLPSPPPALLLMIDETFALLAPENIKSEEGKERDNMHARSAILIGSIARLGRAAGVHMILATQRPDAKVIPGETKANLDARIAQGRMDSIPSNMTLDSDHATRLPPIRGRALIRAGNDFTEFQAYWLKDKDLDIVLEMAAALATGEVTPDMFISPDTSEEDAIEKAKFKMPHISIPLPAGLKEKLKDWVARREEIVKRNEARDAAKLAGEPFDDNDNDHITHSRRDKKKQDDHEGKYLDGGASYREEHEDPDVADVARDLRERGISHTSSDLFDPRADIIDEDDEDDEEHYLPPQRPRASQDRLPSPPSPPLIPSRNPVPQETSHDDLDLEAEEEESDFPSAEQVAKSLNIQAKLAPAVEAVAPEETPPASVEEVLQRANQRGGAILASELLAALKAEAGRLDPSLFAPAESVKEPTEPTTMASEVPLDSVVQSSPVRPISTALAEPDEDLGYVEEGELEVLEPLSEGSTPPPAPASISRTVPRVPDFIPFKQKEEISIEEAIKEIAEVEEGYEPLPSWMIAYLPETRNIDPNPLPDVAKKTTEEGRRVPPPPAPLPGNVVEKEKVRTLPTFIPAIPVNDIPKIDNEVEEVKISIPTPPAPVDSATPKRPPVMVDERNRTSQENAETVRPKRPVYIASMSPVPFAPSRPRLSIPGLSSNDSISEIATDTVSSISNSNEVIVETDSKADKDLTQESFGIPGFPSSN